MFENDNFRKIYVQVILIHFGIRIFKYRMIDCHHHVHTSTFATRHFNFPLSTFAQVYYNDSLFLI